MADGVRSINIFGVRPSTLEWSPSGGNGDFSVVSSSWKPLPGKRKPMNMTNIVHNDLIDLIFDQFPIVGEGER